jgi:hypothetical protein
MAVVPLPEQIICHLHYVTRTGTAGLIRTAIASTPSSDAMLSKSKAVKLLTSFESFRTALQDGAGHFLRSRCVN